MSGNPSAAASSAPPAPPDWRKSVLQSYRNSEVREISKVLAALEGSASVTPASKLMLAMRFEDSIFKTAKDLADYRKKISKRLKKLQKNYVRPVAKTALHQANGSSGKDGATGSGSREDDTEAKEELTAKLKRDCGDALRYIVRNAKAAVADLERKLGPEKARQLQQHTDSCRLWARDLEILTEEELDAITPMVEAVKEKKHEDAKTNESDSKQQQQQQPSSSSQPQQRSQPQKSQPQPQKSEKKTPELSNKAVPLSYNQLQRIEKHLQTRVGNIRSYVVKHADPDQFLLETLQSRDVVFSKNVPAGNLFREILKGRISSQREQLQKATTTSRRSKGSSSNNANQDATTDTNNNDVSNSRPSDDDDPLLVLQKALEKAQAGVPPPTRNDSKKLEGSLRHLDKMRAASTIMMTYWTLPGDQRVETAPRDTLKKIHEVVQDGADFVLKAVRELEKEKQMQQRRYNGSGETVTAGVTTSDATTTSANTKTKSKTKKVSLQDAWSKTIELPSAAAPINVEDDENNSSNSNSNSNGNSKRPRTNSYRPYYKTRMLFRPNRKAPPQLLMAIRRKGADLRQASSCNTDAFHLVLDFDGAFAMTIYFSPLMVTLRAKTPDETNDSRSNSSSSVSMSAPWKPLSHGLTPWGSTLDSSDFQRKKKASQNNNNNNNNYSDGDSQQQQQQLSVWGVTAGYESIGRVVEERLRDASTHATAILRRCFKNHVKDKTVDFEVELLEGSALLEFLSVSRSTYMPQWEDMDVQ